MSILLQVLAVDGLNFFFTRRDPSVDIVISALTFFYFGHFLLSDLKNSTDNSLSDYFEEEFLSKMDS